MPRSAFAQPRSETSAMNAVFEALKSYEQGSGRGALVPLDEAVVASLDNKTARSELERQLVDALKNGGFDLH